MHRRLASCCCGIVLAMWSGIALSAALEFDEYVQRAEAARSRGDWESVASQYAQAINHPDLPKDAATRSRVNLEYGRALGVMCHYEEAEKFLGRAKDIAMASSVSLVPVTGEFAAINLAQKKYSVAVDYYGQLMPVAEREGRAKSAPLVMADAYEKFAVALAATGKLEEAEAKRAEAVKIRETRGKALAPGTITPYGAQCPKA